MLCGSGYAMKSKGDQAHDHTHQFREPCYRLDHHATKMGKGKLDSEDDNAAKAARLLFSGITHTYPLSVSRRIAFETVRPLVGDQILFDHDCLFDAALFTRANAADHVQSLSIASVISLLVRCARDIIEENPGMLLVASPGEPLFQSMDASLRSIVSDQMRSSSLFAAHAKLFLYPVDAINVLNEFECDRFFIASPRDLPKHLNEWYDEDELATDSHPPTPMGKRGNSPTTSAWIGVNAPLSEVSLRVRNTILGAIALLPHWLERYQFTLGSPPSGHMTFDKQAIYHSGDMAAPPVSERINISDNDLPWLNLVHRLVDPRDKADRKAALSLQYFYRAWTKEAANRVSPLCSALDALFGDQNAATKAMIDAVGNHFGSALDETRAKRLTKLRAHVLHGGAPNIYEASVYQRYVADYRRDPVTDLEIVTARCLRHHIFHDVMGERPHTYEDFLLAYGGEDRLI